MNIGIIIFEALSHNLKGVITVGITTGFVIPIFIMCRSISKKLDVIEDKIKAKEESTK